MPIPAATLQEAALRQLIQAGAVTALVVRGQVGGFVIETVMGLDGTRVAILGDMRKGSRVFASVTTVAKLLGVWASIASLSMRRSTFQDEHDRLAQIGRPQ